jgi:hypothetical protein
MQLFSSDVLRVGATEEPSPDRAHPPGHVVPATCCLLCGGPFQKSLSSRRSSQHCLHKCGCHGSSNQSPNRAGDQPR